MNKTNFYAEGSDKGVQDESTKKWNMFNNVLRVFKTNKYDLKVDLKLNVNVAE